MSHGHRPRRGTRPAARRHGAALAGVTSLTRIARRSARAPSMQVCRLPSLAFRVHDAKARASICLPGERRLPDEQRPAAALVRNGGGFRSRRPRPCRGRRPLKAEGGQCSGLASPPGSPRSQRAPRCPLPTPADEYIHVERHVGARPPTEQLGDAGLEIGSWARLRRKKLGFGRGWRGACGSQRDTAGREVRTSRSMRWPGSPSESRSIQPARNNGHTVDARERCRSGRHHACVEPRAAAATSDSPPILETCLSRARPRICRACRRRRWTPPL